MTNNQQLTAIDNEYGASHGTLATYIIGFILSIILTLVAYEITAEHILTGTSVVTAILSLGVGQLLVQLIFFLHLSKKSRARWNLTALIFTGLVVALLVVGTLWIMNNLNYNMTMSFTKNTSVLTAY